MYNSGNISTCTSVDYEWQKRFHKKIKKSWYTYIGLKGWPIEVYPNRPIFSLIRVFVQLSRRFVENIINELKGK